MATDRKSARPSSAPTDVDPEARAVFTNSRNVSQRLQRFCGLASTPLYHPPDQPDAFYCGDAEPYFFFPSRINASKRQGLAIRSLAYADENIRLVICGESEDDAHFQNLEREVSNLGVANRVTFLGRISEKEKRRLYANCLGVLYPPVDEDYGYVTLEAMLASKPVVTCTDSGGPLEFITLDRNGIIASPEPAQVGAAMTILYADRARAAAMGRAGREDYLGRNITWDAVVESLLSAP